MALSPATDIDIAGSDDAPNVRARVTDARDAYHETPASALGEAIGCLQAGRALGDGALCARAVALQGMVSLHRGDLSGGLALAIEAERHLHGGDDPFAHAELAAFKAQLSFFAGSYAEALRHALLAIEHADATGDLPLRVYVRRATCPVFGSVGGKDLEERIEELLSLSIELGSPWQEAISRNDLACFLQEQGEHEDAMRELSRALETAHRIAAENDFALGVIHSTRADILLLLRRPEEALADAERSIELLSAAGDPNPYVLGASVRADVEARMALGRLDDAVQAGEGALSWLGDRVPQTRSMILSTLASTLRAAGRLHEAYDALTRSAELERGAFQELSELQLKLERATLEASAAREASTALAAKNRRLADAHAELERRAIELEALQGELQDQAERDWLTGVYNRRYFARELERMASERRGGFVSLAVIDLDRFKSVNDRFGHEVGDQVLMRVAALLSEVLREQDVVVRSGGEEFLVLMPLTEAAAARSCCERIRTRISEEPWELIAAGLVLTVSVGVASTDDQSELAALAGCADERLYDAKRSGRDRVVGC
ncbi:MAG: diguanylate cyclase [Solirubrobacteraceae bacterium]